MNTEQTGMSLKTTLVISWLADNLQEQPGASVKVSDIARELNGNISISSLGKILKVLFPSATAFVKKTNGKKSTILKGVQFIGKGNLPEGKLLSLTELLRFPARAILIDASTIGFLTDIFQDGNLVLKTVAFRDNKWELMVRNSQVDLESLGVDNTFQPTLHTIKKIIRIVNAMKVCCGFEKLQGREYRQNLREEFIKIQGKDKVVFRSKKCEGVTRWLQNNCRKCHIRNIYRTNAEIERRQFNAAKEKSPAIKVKLSRVSHPCGFCEKNCDDYCVQCDGCDLWYHYSCVGIRDESDLKDQWFCGKCS